MSLFQRIFPERHLIVPLIVAVGWFMEQMDATILSTALPTVAHALHEDPIRLNLAITVYLISMAVFVPLSGWCCDRFGGRRTFQAALIIFALSSVSCAMSNSLLWLVLSRFVQGFGGAMMLPVGRLLVLQNAPRSDMPRAMSYLTIPALLGPVLGPPIGGFIVTYASWRWIFFINVPVAILGFIMTGKFVRNIRETAVPRLDVVGCALSGVGLAGLVFIVEAGGRHAIPFSVIGSVVGVGIVCTFLYIRRSRRIADPIVDFGLMKIPSMSTVVTGGTLMRMANGGLPFLLPLMLQLGFDFTPLQSGLVTFASAFGSIFMKTSIPKVLKRFGFRNTLTYNGFVCCLFLAVNALFEPNTPHLLIFVLMLTGGLFRSIAFTGLSILAYSDIPSDKMNRATTLTTMAQQAGMSLGVGVAAMTLNLLILIRNENAPSVSDFHIGFIVLALSSLCSLFFFLRMPDEAGRDVSGHRAARAAEPDETARKPADQEA